MTIPKNLKEQIHHACEEQELDVGRVAINVERLVADDTCLDYTVWIGSGLGQEELLLDIWVLGGRGLYNYSEFKSLSGSSVMFLDTISNIAIVELEDETSPLVLLFGKEAEAGRVFGKADDREHLEGFRRNVAKARLRYMGLGGGQ